MAESSTGRHSDLLVLQTVVNKWVLESGLLLVTLVGACAVPSSGPDLPRELVPAPRHIEAVVRLFVFRPKKVQNPGLA